MSVKLRMKRMGTKKRPFYRIVATDSRNRREGRFIQELGYYDPLTNPSTFKVDAEKFAHWVRHGAKPSESVAVMMAKIAPEALRPPKIAKAAAPNAEASAAAKPAKKKAAVKKKTVAKKKAATKGTEKKAKARAKAKATKGTAAKPKAAKKAKK